MELIAAFTIGLLGSLHCIGMCGPIALALPVTGHGRMGRVLAAILYNMGRATTYALLGLLLGSVGQALWLAGLQQALSITFGVVILLMVLSPVIFHRISPPAFYTKAVSGLQSKLAIQLKKHGIASLFVIGLLNGLLPCGFVYIALTGAAATGHWYTGAAYMALFGLGTLPLMTLLIMFKNQLGVALRRNLNKALPYAMGIIAVLFIIRGMNLGIPYLSPKAKPIAAKTTDGSPLQQDKTVECH